jgi:hypothetical protein
VLLNSLLQKFQLAGLQYGYEESTEGWLENLKDKNQVNILPQFISARISNNLHNILIYIINL